MNKIRALAIVLSLTLVYQASGATVQSVDAWEWETTSMNFYGIAYSETAGTFVATGNCGDEQVFSFSLGDWDYSGVSNVTAYQVKDANQCFESSVGFLGDPSYKQYAYVSVHCGSSYKFLKVDMEGNVVKYVTLTPNGGINTNSIAKFSTAYLNSKFVSSLSLNKDDHFQILALNGDLEVEYILSTTSTADFRIRTVGGQENSDSFVIGATINSGDNYNYIALFSPTGSVLAQANLNVSYEIQNLTISSAGVLVSLTANGDKAFSLLLDSTDLTPINIQQGPFNSNCCPYVMASKDRIVINNGYGGGNMPTWLFTTDNKPTSAFKVKEFQGDANWPQSIAALAGNGEYLLSIGSTSDSVQQQYNGLIALNLEAPNKDMTEEDPFTTVTTKPTITTKDYSWTKKATLDDAVLKTETNSGILVPIKMSIKNLVSNSKYEKPQPKPQPTQTPKPQPHKTSKPDSAIQITMSFVVFFLSLFMF